MRATIVCGYDRPGRYTRHLCRLYEAAGIEATVAPPFPRVVLFNAGAHHRLTGAVRVITQAPIVHALSGAAFVIAPALASMSEHSRPIAIFESPGLVFSTGTLLSSMGIVSRIDAVGEWAPIEAILRAVIAPPHWQRAYYAALASLRGRALLLHSRVDRISDAGCHGHVLTHMLETGAHACLFYENDFSLVLDHIRAHKVSRPKL
jgi:hypothetical protein